MSSPYTAASVAAATAAVALLLVKAVIVIWWRPKRTESHFFNQGLTGPPYRLLLGNIKELLHLMVKASSSSLPSSSPPFSHNVLPRALPFYHHWKKIYGSTLVMWFGPTARVTVADTGLLGEVLCSKSDSYEKIEPHPVMEKLEGRGLVNLKGETWALHRKIIASAFHSDNIKLWVSEMAGMADRMVERWSAMADAGVVSPEVEVSTSFSTLAEEAIVRFTLGCPLKDFDCVFKLQQRQMSVAGETFRQLYIPFLRFLPTKGNLESWRLEREIRGRLTEMVNRRVLEVESGSGEKTGPKDVLGLMIRSSRSPERSDRSPELLTVEEMVEECKTFLFAGKHTTATLMTWTTVLLAMHPRWQCMARDEVLRVCGSRDPLNDRHVSNLKTLSMVVNESLRLYPPVVAMMRKAKKGVRLGVYEVPGGTELLLQILAVHHDQGVWGSDVNEFDPGRFEGGVAGAARHPMGFIPFGRGSRSCVGQGLATLLVKAVLATILRRFTFRLSPEYRHAPTVSMMLHPQHGAPIVFSPIRHGSTDRRL